MSTFRTIFPKRHTFLPAVHAQSKEQVLCNVKIAQEGGADGVFLINHPPITYEELLRWYWLAKEQFPNFWIGLNCLDLGRRAVTRIPRDVAGLWVDNAGVKESRHPVREAQRFAALRKLSGWKGIYFGGVAFKGQPPVIDITGVTSRAVPFVDVITTSGPETGEPPEVAKIHRMREVMGSHPLAIASGMTVYNVWKYQPYTDCFVVATGISYSFTELNPQLVQAFSRALGR